MSFKLDFFNTAIYNSTDIVSNPIILGKNKKHILIVCNNFEKAEISDFLTKIMSAVNTDLQEDTSIINLKDSKTHSWSGIVKSTAPKKVIFFGIDAGNLGLHIKLLKYQHFSWNGINILASDSLEEIIADKNKKSMLWRELQLMFGKD
jgi:hypothetical protein